jgi:tetratricopeptide (TPR) repeat protein
VSVSWEHAFRACTPAATQVLRAVSTLGLTEVTSPAVGAVCELSSAQTEACLAELVEGGWMTAGVVVEQARRWLARTATVDAGLIRAFAEYHTSAVAGGDWLTRHRAEIMAALRACDRGGLRRYGIALAAAAWSASIRAKDPELWDELAAAGEALAIADRDPAGLASLLHSSATVFAEHGDQLRAEAQWVRALAVVRRDADVEHRGVDQAVLSGLGDLYRGWGRLGKALDTDLALVDLQRSAGDAAGIADALAQVAATMRASGRLNSAADYFAQADDALSGSGGSPEVHARILTSWGRALWDQQHHAAARRRWSKALAMLIDVDDKAADHVRALLASPDEGPLPPDYEGVSNTSWSSSGGNG